MVYFLRSFLDNINIMKILLQIFLISIILLSSLGAQKPFLAEEEVVRLCNNLRIEQGLPPLACNWEVASVARHRTEDMMAHSYFGHDSPVYGCVFDMLKNFNIKYNTAGENIAAGFASPQAVVDAWMAQPNHRMNIMSTNFNQVGVGYSNDGTSYYWALILLGD